MKKGEVSRDTHKEGEYLSLEKAITVYGPHLIRSAFLLCGREADAHDMVQETFLQALKSIHRFKGKSSLFTWMYGILLNVFRQQMRKKKRHFGSLSDSAGNNSNMVYNPEHNLNRERLFSRVYSLLQTLSPRHREVLILRYYGGFKIGEIAEITRVSGGTVKSRLHYATEALRKKIPPDLNLSDRSITHK